MSGSNAMCATTALLEIGLVPMQEPVVVITFDTAAGLVPATVTCAVGKVVKVTLDMPPSFFCPAGRLDGNAGLRRPAP
jgi:proline racemase